MEAAGRVGVPVSSAAECCPGSPTRPRGRRALASAARALVDEGAAEGLYAFREIGVCESVFANKRGVPRQGALAPAAAGCVQLHPHVSRDVLLGIESFSHVWLLFVFSRNTNKDKVRAWVAPDPNRSAQTFPAKVRPPLMAGASTGVFSSRSPHRPNPIGLTLATVRGVEHDARRLLVGGIDLCNGTPVLDIKPFVPADVPGRVDVPARFAPWVLSEEGVGLSVAFSDAARADLARLLAAHVPNFYTTSQELEAAVEQVISLDVRAVHQGRGVTSGLAEHQCVVDSVQFFFTLAAAQGSVLVTRAVEYDASCLAPV